VQAKFGEFPSLATDPVPQLLLDTETTKVRLEFFVCKLLSIPEEVFLIAQPFTAGYTGVQKFQGVHALFVSICASGNDKSVNALTWMV